MSDFFRTHLGLKLANVIIDSLPKIAKELKRANDLKEQAKDESK